MTSNTAEAGKQDFTIVNFSGQTISRFYVSRSDRKNWEENVLRSSIPHGSSRNITFNENEDGKFWDMRAVFADGSEGIWYGIDLTTVYRVRIDGVKTLHYN